MTHLHFDLISGIAGDMTVAALIDAGVPFDYIRRELDKLHLHGFSVAVERADCGQALTGLRFLVELEDEHAHHHHDHHDHDHHHEHDHHHASHHEHRHDHDHDGHTHPHTHDDGTHHAHPHDHDHDHDHHDHDHDHHHHHNAWRDIRAMLEAAPLSDRAKRLAIDIFARIADSEGRVHGIAPDDVHFHEVGAIDSIVDIVATAVAIDYLNPTRITASPVPLGRGFTWSQHGRIPLPAPATLFILQGAPIVGTGLPFELVTPTGAGILAALVESWEELPAMSLERVGHGAGTRQLPDRPNLLRVLIGADKRDAAGLEHSRDLVLEANIDDMTGELAAWVAERLMEAGALDVWWTPIVMKKGRPAQQLSALCPPERRDTLIETILSESTTLGVRVLPVARLKARRALKEVQTPHGSVTIKVGLVGDRIANVAPEFEAARQLALQAGVPLKVILQAAMSAAAELFPVGATLDANSTPTPPSS